MYDEIWQHDGQTATDPIVTYGDLPLEEDAEVCDALTTLLADLFALYVKTKVFHWHVSGLGSQGGPLVLAEQADQVLVTIDTIGERVRALGGTPIRSIGEISRLHWIRDGASADPTMPEMLAALLREQDARQADAAELRAVQSAWRFRQRNTAGGLDRRGRGPLLVPL